jgi:hypothetical protein
MWSANITLSNFLFQDKASGIDQTKLVWLMKKSEVESVLNGTEIATDEALPAEPVYESLDGRHRISALRAIGYGIFKTAQNV